ncbi:MAG: hypothetical protein JNL81_09110 [Hyphomonadaceae bacterium]|nr:hypothetical protein [Hyphomonadaceae bacterium]
MVKVFGPDTSFAKSAFDADEIPFEVDAATLGEALDAYSRNYGVAFATYDGSWPTLPFDPSDPKWFFYRSKRPKWEEVVVDVHIERGDEEICPRQNLAFPLRVNDEIHIGPLAC